MRFFRKGRRRASVVVYLASAFGICIVALGTLLSLTTTSSFQRERNRTASELRSIAQSDADDAGGVLNESLSFLENLASATSLDPTQCRAALAPLGSLLTAPEVSGHVEVYRADGSLVCELRPPTAKPIPAAKGPWLQEVLKTKEPVDGGTLIDPITDVPSMVIGIPVTDATGQTGVMAVTMSTSASPLWLPPGTDKQVVLLELDPTRKIVIAATKNSPTQPGPTPAGWMSKPLRGTTTLTDVDGTERIYSEVKATNGWHVLAGIPKSVALKSAQAELKRNLMIAAAVVALVSLLGVILTRRLARPIRRLGTAIEAARTDSSARAVVEGPAEIAAVAEAFNETIEERRQLELQLTHQALHDPLTGLPNRALLDDRLNNAVERRSRDGDHDLAVLFFDVDRFKVINDSYGHERGDQVLVAVADRIKSELRPGDTVARFGGDEFVILAEGIESEAHALEVASRLQFVLEQPFVIDGTETHVTTTVGVALATSRTKPGDLLRDADAAMYRGKERGRGGIELFDEALGKRARKRAEIETAMRRALNSGEFVVHYQPEVSVSTGEMTGVEALVRWDRPRVGMQLPAEFIPIAEETGMILELGDFVLREACRQLAAWLDDGFELTMAVNLAPRQLTDPELPARVKAILRETGAPAERLVLEMTESALVEDDPRTMAVLHGLKKMGVRLALDDFGTGYASLSYLRHFPVDVVKVDRSFISDLGRKGGGAIVAAVLAMGESLGLTTVAEGVETPKQLGALQEMGCALAQGFYFSRPAEPAVIRKLAGRTLRPRRRNGAATRA